MPRFRRLILFLALLAACGGATDATSQNLLGKWLLHDVDGTPLPYPDGPYVIQANTLEFEPGGSGQIVTIQSQASSPGTQNTYQSPLTWRASGTSVILDIAQTADTMQLAGDTLTWVAVSGGTTSIHHFRKQ